MKDKKFYKKDFYVTNKTEFLMGNNFWSTSLGIIDLNFLEFLSLGNNFFLSWLIFGFFYIKFLEKFFVSYSVLYSFKFSCLVAVVRFTSLNFFLLPAYRLSIFCFSFYEYFSIVFPFFGIFISLSLNFLLLSIGNSEILGINFLLLIIGKQWGWNIFYFFIFGSLKFFSFCKYLENNFLYLNFFKDGFWNFKSQNFLYNSVLSSNYSEGPFHEEFFSITSNLIFFFKDFNLEGVINFIFILEGFCHIFYVTSLDVIHSFGVPSLGIKLDVIPGFFSGGILEIQAGYLLDILEFGCYEFCGINHSGMMGKIFIISINYFFYFF